MVPASVPVIVTVMVPVIVTVMVPFIVTDSDPHNQKLHRRKNE